MYPQPIDRVALCLETECFDLHGLDSALEPLEYRGDRLSEAGPRIIVIGPNHDVPSTQRGPISSFRRLGAPRRQSKHSDFVQGIRAVLPLTYEDFYIWFAG
jgi:hypothetical protein